MRYSFLFAVALVSACAQAGRGAQTDASSHDDSGGGPVDSALDAFACSQMPCSILPQCGCKTAFVCDVDTTDADGTACRKVTTPGTNLSTCDSLDDCDGGYVCLGNGTSASCKAYCTSDTDCGTPRGKCVIDVSSGGTPVPNLPTVCSSNCDPADATGALCPPTFKCSIFNATHNATSVQITDCTLAGAGGQGANCKVGTTGDESMCAKGLMCTTTDSGTTFKCRKVCTTPGATSAACGGQTCITFNPAISVGGTNYGVCAP